MVLLYSSQLIGQGPGKTSAYQGFCLTKWLESTPNITVSEDLTPVVSVAYQLGTLILWQHVIHKVICAHIIY